MKKIDLYLGTQEGIWSGRGVVKRAVETSCTRATGASKTLRRAVVTSGTGGAALHGHPSCRTKEDNSRTYFKSKPPPVKETLWISNHSIIKKTHHS